MNSKMLTAYISVSRNIRKFIDPEIRVISEALTNFNVTPFVFVDKYHFTALEQKQMMQQAVQDIDTCDLLIAETSDKAIGIGIEVGYAKAKNKPVLYLRHTNAAHSTTVSGISDVEIIYLNCQDLQKQLRMVLPEILAALK